MFLKTCGSSHRNTTYEHALHHVQVVHGVCDALRPTTVCDCANVRLWALAARTWHGVLHMRPLSMNSIAYKLPMACARRRDPPVLVIVSGPQMDVRSIPESNQRGLRNHVIMHMTCPSSL